MNLYIFNRNLSSKMRIVKIRIVQYVKKHTARLAKIQQMCYSIYEHRKTYVCFIILQQRKPAHGIFMGIYHK